MNELNKLSGIKEPKLLKEKTTGKWLVAFEYRDNEGKLKRHYYSKGLNDRIFFQYDNQGRKKVDSNGVVLRNIKKREELAKKRIAKLNQELENLVYDTKAHCYILGDLDKDITELIIEFIEFKKSEGNVNNKSILQYVSKLNGLKKFLKEERLEGITLKKFHKEHLNLFYSNLLNTLGYSKSYRDDYHRFFVAFYNYLINYKEIDISNITKSFKLIKKGTTKLHQSIDAKYLDKVVAEIQQYNFYLGLLYKFIFFTLHRIETLTQIQFKNINLENDTIHLPSDIVKNHEEITISLAYAIKVEILKFLEENEVKPDYYLFGETNKRISLFGVKPSKANTFSSQFSVFKSKKLKSNNKTFITEFSSLYSAKHSGVKFLLDSGLSLNQIISVTGHTNTNQLGAYAKDYKPSKVNFPLLPVQEK